MSERSSNRSIAAIGCMEQLDNLILSFDAIAERGGDAAAPFSLRVSGPKYDEERGYFCHVECPLLRKKPFTIFGIDEEQACELSISFIRQSLIDVDVDLVDANGNEVDIPAINFSRKTGSE